MAAALRVVLVIASLRALAAAQPCADALSNTFQNEEGDFALSWAFNDDGTVDIEYSLPGSAFIGLGLGGSMYDTDMVLSWVLDNGTVVTNDYWSTHHAPPSTDVSLGGTDNVAPVCGQRVGNMTTVRYRRPTAATDPAFDKPVLKGVNDMVFAWLHGTPGVVGFHGDNHNHVQVDFSEQNGVPQNEFGDEETGLAARRLINASLVATLVTLQTEYMDGRPQMQGYPFGSVASYVDDGSGQPILLLSQLERNIINWSMDQRCSLTVHANVQVNATSDPMSSPRTTLMGTLIPVPDPEVPAARAVYLAAHPYAVNWVDFGDFSFYTFNVTDVYFVGGFGNMHYIGFIDAEDYLSHTLP